MELSPSRVLAAPRVEQGGGEIRLMRRVEFAGSKLGQGVARIYNGDRGGEGKIFQFNGGGG